MVSTGWCMKTGKFESVVVVSCECKVREVLLYISDSMTGNISVNVV